MTSAMAVAALLLAKWLEHEKPTDVASFITYVRTCVHVRTWRSCVQGDIGRWVGGGGGKGGSEGGRERGKEGEGVCGGRGRCGWEGPEWGHLLRMLRDVVFGQPQVRKYTSTYVCSEASKVLLCGSCLRELRGPKPRHARHSSPGPQPKPRFAQPPSHGPKPRHATQSL